MKRSKIVLQGKQISYIVKKRKGLSRLKLEVNADGSLSLTFPYYVPYFKAPLFIYEKADWILRTLQKFENQTRIIVTKNDADLKKESLQLLKDKINCFNKFYQYKVTDIKVRKYKSRWGCCDQNGVLTFNCKLCLLPERLVDYIVVHELCHLKEFNHSPNFWKLVSQSIPNYQQLKQELKYLVILDNK